MSLNFSTPGRFFIYSNLYVVIPIAALVTETYLLAGKITFNPNLLLFVSFSTVFLYPLHRIVGSRHVPSFERQQLHHIALKNQNIIGFFVAAGLVGSIYYFFQLTRSIQVVLLFTGLISVAYSIPFIPLRGKMLRLRDIPYLKIYLIALVVSLVTATLPLLDVGDVSLVNHLLVFAMRFIFILAITIPFDIRDMPYDNRWDLKTIPLILGEDQAINLAKFLMHFTTVIAFILALVTQFFSFYIFLALFLSEILITVILHHWKANNSDTYNVVLIEGSMLYQFALVTLAAVLLG